MSKLSEIDENLLAKYLGGQATADDLQKLDAWLESDTANTLELDRYRKLWDLKPKTNIHFETDVNFAWQKVQNRIQNKPQNAARISSIFLRNFSLAASVALIIGFGFYTYFFKETTPIYQTVISQNSPLNKVMADSSKVYLYNNSKLEYPEQFSHNERRVKLKGEAFFDVKPNPAKPFTIEVGMLNIKVLGTSFNIKEDTISIEVMVKTGKVMVSKSASEAEILLAGEAIVYDKIKKTYSQKQPVNPNEFAYYNKVFSFNNASLAQVIKTLRKGYNAKIRVENDELSQLSITTKFENENLNDALQIVAETLQLKLEITNNEYVFVRK